MGSCYSTKANQMPLQGNKKCSSQDSSPGQTKMVRPTSQKGRGGSSSFGFNRQPGRGKPTSSAAAHPNNNDISNRHSSNDALKNIQDEGRVSNNSPKSRFGFNRSSTNVGVSNEKIHSQRFDSMESVSSIKSDISKGSYKVKEVKPPGSTGSQKKMMFTHNNVSFKPRESKSVKMIDDMESSQKSVSPVHTSSILPKDDDVNANIPNNVNICSTSENDVNGNSGQMHSNKPEHDVAVHKNNLHGKSITSKLPSKFRRPFVKSKTFSGQDLHLPEEEVEHLSILKTAHSKDSILSKQNITKTSNSSEPKQLQARSSFLKRGFFSRQKNVSTSNEKTSQAKANKNLQASQEKSKMLQLVKKSKDTEYANNQVLKTKQEVVLGSCKNNEPNSSENDISETDAKCDIRALDNVKKRVLTPEPLGTPNANSKIHSSIPSDLKDRLEKAHIPKGIAPIAMLDSVETTSIGSIDSDDLMLDLDLDLGPYDDDDELAQSTASFDKTSGVMRNRSRSGSGRIRSRSRSHEKIQKREIKYLQSKDNCNDLNGATDNVSCDTVSSIGTGYQQKANVHNVSASGMERRDNWYRKRYNSQSKGDESIDELHSLIDLQRPVHRRFTPHEKATRPASFPGGIQQQISDPNPKEITTPPINQVFRPPRLPSVTDDDKIPIDGFTYRQMAQDMTALKTMLFKLKRVIQDDELGSPMGTPSWKNGLAFSTSQPGSPYAKFADRSFNFSDYNKEREQQTNLENVLKENEDLKSQVHMLKQQVEEQERTIKLLQQQMPKNNHASKGGRMSAKRTLQYSGSSSSTTALQKREKPVSNTNKKVGFNASERSRPVTSTIIPDTSEYSDDDDELENIIATEHDPYSVVLCDKLEYLEPIDEDKTSDSSHSDSLQNIPVICDNEKNISSMYVNNLEEISPTHFEVVSPPTFKGVEDSLKEYTFDKYGDTVSKYIVNGKNENHEAIVNSISDCKENIIHDPEEEIIHDPKDKIIQSTIVHKQCENENIDPNISPQINNHKQYLNSDNSAKNAMAKKKVTTGLPVPSGLPRYGIQKGKSKGNVSKLPNFANVKKITKSPTQLRSFSTSAK